MRRRMANDFQPIGIFPGDDGQLGIALYRKTGVHHLAVDFASQSGLGQTSANRHGYLGHRDRAWKFTLRTVGKCDLNHVPE